MDAVHRHCDILHPAFWQTLHILSVTETNGLGSQTTTIRFRLHELRKLLLSYTDVYILGHFRAFPAVVAHLDIMEEEQQKQDKA